MFELSMLLQLSASLITAASIYKMGDKTTLGPLLGSISQVPWWWFMVLEGLWGLLPLNILMLCIHVRNYIKWKGVDHGSNSTI